VFSVDAGKIDALAKKIMLLKNLKHATPCPAIIYLSL